MSGLITAASDAALGELALTGLVTGAVSVVVSLVIARLTFQFVRRPELNDTFDLKKREIAETVRADLEKEQQQRKAARAEMVRQKTVASAGPLLVAIEDLLRRLDNILEEQAYGPLAPDWSPRDRRWSSTHEYFMGSTLYLFGRYFAWVQLLSDRLGADEYLPHHDKDQLLVQLHAVRHALTEFPAVYTAGCPGDDAQVFSWQQVAMGEVLIRMRDDGSATVGSYADFVGRTQAVSAHFDPLKALLVGLGPAPDENCRWQRLTSTREALVGARDECRRILGMPGPEPATATG